MTTRTGQGFPKAARIRRRREFLAFGRSGERRRTESFVILAMPAIDRPRLGLTISRKIGNATVRNRLKRRLREVFRRHPSRASFGQDVVLIAKEGAGALSFDALLREFDAAQARRVPSQRPSRV
jgi:ribonuclease P protein component